MSGKEFYLGNSFFRDSSFPFLIDIYTIQKEETITRHSHDFVELAYIYRGSASHEMLGKEYNLESGDVFIIEPNVYHSYQGNPYEEAVVYNIMFKKELLQELPDLKKMPIFLELFYLAPFLRKSSMFYPYLKITGRHKLQFELSLDFMLQEWKESEAGYQFLIKTRLMECLIYLSRYCQISDRPTNETTTDKQWMASIVSLLKQHYNQPFTLDQISRMCCMSVAAFTMKFKGFTGKTFLEYKHDLQMQEACLLLKQGSQKIAQIAAEVGFEDISFFYKVFRKKTGQTPLQYRRATRMI